MFKWSREQWRHPLCVDSENRAQVDGNSYKKGLLLFFEKVFKFIRTTKKLKCT